MPHDEKGGKGYGPMSPGMPKMDDSKTGMSADAMCKMAGEKAMKDAAKRMKRPVMRMNV